MARQKLALLIFFFFPLLATAQQTALQQAGVCSRCHVAQVLEWSASKHTAAGIACRNCHGPSQGHVTNERNQVKPDRLPQNQAIAPFCASCHNAGCPKTGQKTNCQSCHHVHALSNPNDQRMRPAESPEAKTFAEYRRLMEQAESHVTRGQWPQARDGFQSALKLRPNDARAAARLKMAVRRLKPAIPGFTAIGNEFDQASGLPLRVRVDGFDMEMRLMPAADFDMGSERIPKAQPVHSVRIEPFYIAVTELTQKQWSAISAENPSILKGDTLPVHNVSWDDTQQAIAKLNAKIAGAGFRLPTEAEWEYAAHGDTPSAATAWFRDNSATTAQGAFRESNAYAPRPAGAKQPNARGLYDLAGNVAEWCSSLYQPYPYDARDGREASPGPGLRVIRGGAYLDGLDALDPAARHADRPNRRIPWNGLRLARTVE
ncbi:MAG: SUMF1/EgtB/PvdO family nonheme iron enzyme [Bryobacteraceae bacterium]